MKGGIIRLSTHIKPNRGRRQELFSKRGACEVVEESARVSAP